ncbi:hypothetical protein EIN_063470 [Entamoeba invadens IP1]|uniref:hypothetical protein n=1 Tax=Entamoeba invadens IP1 TaxID=370355 RepID=UPI0002C3F0D6|nr:hypothetical protein EIN_063470 [Entamoeba invadens IP1]ELP93602.1 hypothetical protein EIN_063470 [Entamoeba invadens IP1]|eukprot:XP_004260373.1 hypothetical protein EIN_063470 [Entamoeba invadens IP1]
MKSGVIVGIRIRPQNDSEINDSCVKAANKTTLVYFSSEKDFENFNFDFVADQDSTQEQLFTTVGIPLVDTALSGYNSSLFAYGQTGSGKTFTTFGDCDKEELRGIIPRSLKYLFERLNNQNEGGVISSVSCSMVEIYNENLIDLIDKTKSEISVSCVGGVPGETLKPRKLPVNNPEQVSVTNWESTWAIIQRGYKMRHTSATLSNDHSSRSHCVFTVFITKQNNSQNSQSSTTTSKLTFVDLAGSERQSKTQTKGETLKEAGNINKSLVTFGRVIHGLVQQSEGKECFIPYRDSKLTQLMRDSLGGNCKTFIIGTVSPSMSAIRETSSTIKFCFSSRNIQCIVKKNNVFSGTNEQLKDELDRLRAENEELRNCRFPMADTKELEKAKGQIRHLEFTMFAKMDQERYLKEVIEELKGKVKDKDNELLEWKKKCKEMEDKRKMLERSIENFRSQKKTVNEMKKFVTDEMERWKVVEQENPELLSLKNENKELKEQIEKTLNGENRDELNLVIMEKSDEITVLMKQLREVSEEKQNLEKEKDALKKNATECVVNEFKDKLKNCEMQIVEFKCALEHREKRIEDLTIDNEALVVMVDQLTDRIGKYSRKSVMELKEEVLKCDEKKMEMC